MRKFIFLYLIFYCSGIILQAQQKADVPNVIKPPNLTQQFQKYFDYPVSYSTGIPDINIPLFDFSTNGYTIPFQLRYHSSGIKPSQVPGPIGYGWALLPSYRVSRIVNNKADEVCLSDAKDIRSAGDLSFEIKDATETLRYLENMSNCQFVDEGDGQFDVFSLQLPNHNLNFIFEKRDGQLNIVPIQPTQLKIIPIYDNTKSNFKGFDVLDENGVLYKFGSDKDGYEEYPIERAITTSWMLYKIVLQGNDEITFSYTTRYLDLPIRAQYTDEQVVYDNFVCHGDACANTNNDSKVGLTGSEYTYLKKIEPRTIDQQSKTCLPLLISSANSSIEFNYKSKDSWNLDNISVFGKNKQIIKTIDFQREEGKDNLLSSLSISGNGKYTFSYNGNGTFGDHFFGFFSQDYWGYYNDQGNSTLSPLITIYGRDDIKLKTQIGNASRTPVENAMKTNILTKITYPTGGHVDFSYEANRYFDNISKSEKIIGGLRIKEMKIYDPLSNNTTVKSYIYEDPNVSYIPKEEDYVNTIFMFEYFDKINDVYWKYTANPIFRKRESVRSSYLDQYMSFNLPIWYGKVTEFSNAGKTEFYYSRNYSNYNADLLTDTYTRCDLRLFVEHIFSLIFVEPYLYEQNTYKSFNGNYQLIRKKNNNYEFNEIGEPIRGFISDVYTTPPKKDYLSSYPSWRSVFNNSITTNSWMTTFFISEDNAMQYYKNFFSFANYYIHRGINLLKSTTETDYTSNGNISKTITYNYDPIYLYNIKEQIETTSQNGSIKTNYYYPYDVVNGIDASMRNMMLNNNKQTSVIQKEIYANNSLTFTEQFLFKDWGNRIVMSDKTLSKEKTNPFTTVLTYDLYDSKGNLLQYTAKDGVPVSFVWGYNQQYPIAKVVGATFAQVKSALGQTLTSNDLAYLQNYTGSTLTTELKKLRDYFNDNATAKTLKAQVFTYTYQPLVGMTSETDPNNVTTYYEYDSFGRLSRALDNNKNVLKQYEYNYKQ